MPHPLVQLPACMQGHAKWVVVKAEEDKKHSSHLLCMRRAQAARRMAKDCTML